MPDASPAISQILPCWFPKLGLPLFLAPLIMAAMRNYAGDRFCLALLHYLLPLERSYKKRRAVVLPCSITLSSPPLQKICCRVFTLPLRIRNVSSSGQSIYSNTPNLRQEVSNFYMQPRFVQLDLSQLILPLPAVCKESLIKSHGFAETYSFKQPNWWNELNY